MKNLSLLLAISISSLSFAQLITIKAIGGEGKSVEWATKYKDYYKDPNAESFIGGPCNQGATAVRASSQLPNSKTGNYAIINLVDDNPMTAWVEGVKGYGIGEWFEIKGSQVNRIYNGYQSSPLNWVNNSRVKAFKVYKNNNPLCLLELTDEMGQQHFELPAKPTDFDSTFIFKFEIVEVYKGLKWDDVCISFVGDIRCCFSANTFINTGTDLTSILDISNSPLINVDLADNKTSRTKVLSSTSQKHLSLYKLSTATKAIEVTLDHPLNFKNYGFTSIGKILKTIELNSIINTLEVMVWNNELHKTEFEKVSSIEKIEGVFDTYTILKIEQGNTYIANGFITKTY